MAGSLGEEHASLLEEAPEFRHRGDTHATDRLDYRFGLEADREAGDFEHGEIVRTVADRDGFGEAVALGFGETLDSSAPVLPLAGRGLYKTFE